MEQMNLWNFIPECEDGKLAHNFLYFSEEAHAHWMSPWYESPYSVDRQLKGEQIDIFEVLGTSEEEIYKMSNMAELSIEELEKYLKYMSPADRNHWGQYLGYRTGRFPIQEINYVSTPWLDKILKDRFKENSEETSFEKKKVRKGFRGYHGEESELKKFLKKKGGK